MMVDTGFDVYLSNSRGNRYSREHVILKPNEPEFWKWSWQEMAKYDIPATIDIVLKTSKKPNLYYIGHSQGTLTMLTYLSETQDTLPEEHRKIRCFFALAPIARLKNIKSNIRHLAAVAPVVEMGQWLMGGAELLPSTATGRWVAKQMSKVHNQIATLSPTVDDKATSLLTSITGFNQSHYFRQYLPVYRSHTPAGTSLQNIIHFAQMVQCQKMQKYDFKDEETNKNRYMTRVPPEIDLAKVTTPIVAYYGTDDDLSTVEDVEWALEQLPNVVESVKLDAFDHLDFVYGTRAPTYLYSEIIDFIRDAARNFE
jgi:pimeloyl-ACP methyl ester carboxylesterase